MPGSYLDVFTALMCTQLQIRYEKLSEQELQGMSTISRSGRLVTGQLNHVHNATIQCFTNAGKCVHADMFPSFAHVGYHICGQASGKP